MIYIRHKDSISINEKDFIKKIKQKKNNFKNKFLLSEIFFNKKKNISLEDQINEIEKSIRQNGFSNTANIYSISQSSKFGAKLVGLTKVI